MNVSKANSQRDDILNTSKSSHFSNVSFLDADKACMIDMVIPTGAMGNLTGGYMAKKMGVPIGRLCAGVNINGEYST